jgi:hypothetical protein
MTLSEHLQEIRERLNAATPGPWGLYNNGFDAGVVSGLKKAKNGKYTSNNCGLDYDELICGGEPHEGHFDGPNAIFVANAPTDIDRLMRVIEVLSKGLNDAEFELKMVIESKTSVNMRAVDNIKWFFSEAEQILRGEK